MEKSKIRELITENLKSNRRFSFFKKFKDERVHGCILNYSEDFVLIHQTDDFQLDGYAILPIDAIEEVRYNEMEEFYDSVMQQEGLLDDFGIDYSIDLSSWQTIFDSIIKNEKFAIIECEKSDDDDSQFLLGKIIRTKRDKFEMIYLNADGIFEDTITEQKYSEITIVRFDERYTNLFQKYAKNNYSNT
jgi:hypothetical protein